MAKCKYCGDRQLKCSLCQRGMEHPLLTTKAPEFRVDPMAVIVQRRQQRPVDLFRSPCPGPFPLVAHHHLLYHVYPRHGSAWRRSVHAVRSALYMFDTAHVAVVYDSSTEHPNMVRDALAGTKAEVFAVQNDPQRREVATFEALFSRVEKLQGATLYGHAKGTSRPDDLPVHRWAEVCEEVCFRREAALHLTQYPVTGPFKKVGHGWPQDSSSDWHYSGTWFWFRNDALFSRDWRRIDQFWGGIEPYISLHFAAEDAGCLFHEARVEQMNLYNRDYWDSVVEPQFADWRRTHQQPPAEAPKRAAPLSSLLNYGCGPFRAEGWWNTDVLSNEAVRPDEVVHGGLPLPWDAGTFNAVYLGHVMEHVEWGQVVPTLVDVRRVCTTGSTVVVVGPDVTHPQMRGVLIDGEDHSHHQRESLDHDWVGARHHWNMYPERVVWAMQKAGYSDVRSVELSSLAGSTWPVVDFGNPAQTCVVGVV